MNQQLTNLGPSSWRSRVNDEGLVVSCENAAIEAVFTVFAQRRAALANSVEQAQPGGAFKAPTGGFEIALAEGETVAIEDDREIHFGFTTGRGGFPSEHGEAALGVGDVVGEDFFVFEAFGVG
jgi:hypothetical protein